MWAQNVIDSLVAYRRLLRKPLGLARFEDETQYLAENQYPTKLMTSSEVYGDLYVRLFFGRSKVECISYMHSVSVTKWSQSKSTMKNTDD